MFLSLKSGKAYYEALGEGMPILLLHGWGANTTSMRQLLRSLHGENLGTRIIAPDFPGFGDSTCPETAWTVDDYCNFVVDFMDTLALQDAVLIAHSFGGRVAIKLAALRPQRVRALVLVDSAGLRPSRGLRYYTRVYAYKCMKWIMRISPLVLRQTLNKSGVMNSAGSEDYRSAGVLRGTFVKVVNEDLRQYLPLICCPTLLIWGSEDDSTPLRDAYELQQKIVASRLEVLQGAGHFSFLDAPERFNTVLFPFIKSIINP